MTFFVDESELASAVSRSGDKEEALGGPFVYVIIMFLSTLLFWFDNLSGVIAMTVMAVGDGVSIHPSIPTFQS